ncbi:MAG TPA: hypothetical protein VHF28_04465 [Nitrososphaera sp.]|nr:hypothetical protein [Nitrososphaera sp.]
MASADEETKERVTKAGGERQGHRIRKDCPKQPQGWRVSLSGQRANVRDWQKRRTKLNQTGGNKIVM